MELALSCYFGFWSIKDQLGEIFDLKVGKKRQKMGKSKFDFDKTFFSKVGLFCREKISEQNWPSRATF
jgi:hypothetical protein